MKDAFKKPTVAPGGLQCGGGDTDADSTPQPIYVGRWLSTAVPTASFKIPAGTVILRRFVMPQAGGAADGTVDLGTLASGNRYGNDIALNAWSDAAAAVVEQVTVDTTVVFTSASLTAGRSMAGLVILPPGLRP